jgi:hypothetical protein
MLNFRAFRSRSDGGITVAFQLPTRILSRSLLVLSLSVIGCDPTAEQELASTPSDEGVDALKASLGESCPELCGGQCVAYAHCKAPGLPGGLYTWADKKAIINSNHAHPGCVAMINTGSVYGHVAYVSEVRHDPNGLTIREANWVHGQCTLREGTKGALNIENYWCPGSVHTSTCPGKL